MSKMNKTDIKILVNAVKTVFPRHLKGYNFVAINKMGEIRVYDKKPQINSPKDIDWTENTHDQLHSMKIFETPYFVIDNWKELCFKI